MRQLRTTGAKVKALISVITAALAQVLAPDRKPAYQPVRVRVNRRR